jgi:hypothetical protein
MTTKSRSGTPSASSSTGAWSGVVQRVSRTAETAPHCEAKLSRLNSTLEVAQFTARLHQLEREGKHYAAGDLVFDFFEDWFELREPGLSVCEEVLESLELDRLSDTVVVAILAVTQPARSGLPSRPVFLKRARERLIITNGPEEAALIAQTYE